MAGVESKHREAVICKVQSEVVTNAHLINNQFDPDGRSITLMIDALGGRQAWKLPYPPGTASPERIMKGLNSFGSTPRWSWFPNGRNGFMSSVDEQGGHIRYAGIHSGPERKLTVGTPAESDPLPCQQRVGYFKAFLFIAIDWNVRPWGLVGFYEGGFEGWELVVIAGNPHVERRKQIDAHYQRTHQSADNHDGERALRIGADTMGRRCGN